MGSGEREGYRQLYRGQSITEGFQESSSASFMKVISRSVISSEVPRVSRELSVLITELLITFRGSVFY